MWSINSYKPGQGKTARLLTAAGLAAVFLGVIFWVTAETGILFRSLQNVPIEFGTVAANYERRLEGKPNTQLQVGSESAAAIANHFGEELRNANIRIVQPESREIDTAIIEDINVEAGTLSLNKSLKNDYTTAAQVQAVQGKNYLIWIKWGVAIFLLLAAGIFMLWVLNRPRIVDFLIATEAEMRKVNWPARREVIGSTWVVVLGTLMMALLLWVVDVVFAELFISIDVLEGKSTLMSLIGG